MGRAASKLTRPLRLYNIENRANRALEKQHEQAIASPKHPTTKDHISQLQRDHPEFLSQQQEKNEALHENLKGLYAEPDHAPKEMKHAHRPLPESRTANPETDMGIMDTFHTIKEGRANLKTIIGFISQHQIDPNNMTAQSIAEEHKLDMEEVEKVLNHFKALTLHIPQEMYKKNPKLKQIVADQIKSASHSVAQLQMSLPKDDKKIDPNSDKT